MALNSPPPAPSSFTPVLSGVLQCLDFSLQSECDRHRQSCSPAKESLVSAATSLNGTELTVTAPTPSEPSTPNREDPLGPNPSQAPDHYLESTQALLRSLDESPRFPKPSQRILPPKTNQQPWLVWLRVGSVTSILVAGTTIAALLKQPVPPFQNQAQDQLNSADLEGSGALPPDLELTATTPQPQQVQGFYLVILDSQDPAALARVKPWVPDAFMKTMPDGSNRIQVGAFVILEQAQQSAQYLADQGITARVYSPQESDPAKLTSAKVRSET